MTTACLLMERNKCPHCTYGALEVARLASDIHRLAPACDRQAVAECNGEVRDGDRERARKHWTTPAECGTARLDREIAAIGERLDRRLAKLNESLAPFALRASRNHDPRSHVLRLYSTDKSRPIASNCGDGESFAIEGKRS